MIRCPLRRRHSIDHQAKSSRPTPPGNPQVRARDHGGAAAARPAPAGAATGSSDPSRDRVPREAEALAATTRRPETAGSVHRPHPSSQAASEGAGESSPSEQGRRTGDRPRQEALQELTGRRNRTAPPLSPERMTVLGRRRPGFAIDPVRCDRAPSPSPESDSPLGARPQSGAASSGQQPSRHEAPASIAAMHPIGHTRCGFLVPRPDVAAHVERHSFAG